MASRESLTRGRCEASVEGQSEGSRLRAALRQLRPTPPARPLRPLALVAALLCWFGCLVGVRARGLATAVEPSPRLSPRMHAKREGEGGTEGERGGEGEGEGGRERELGDRREGGSYRGVGRCGGARLQRRGMGRRGPQSPAAVVALDSNGLERMHVMWRCAMCASM